MATVHTLERGLPKAQKDPNQVAAQQGIQQRQQATAPAGPAAPAGAPPVGAPPAGAPPVGGAPQGGTDVAAAGADFVAAVLQEPDVDKSLQVLQDVLQTLKQALGIGQGQAGPAGPQPGAPQGVPVPAGPQGLPAPGPGGPAPGVPGGGIPPAAF